MSVCWLPKHSEDNKIQDTNHNKFKLQKHTIDTVTINYNIYRETLDGRDSIEAEEGDDSWS